MLLEILAEIEAEILALGDCDADILLEILLEILAEMLALGLWEAEMLLEILADSEALGDCEADMLLDILADMLAEMLGLSPAASALKIAIRPKCPDELAVVNVVVTSPVEDKSFVAFTSVLYSGVGSASNAL